MNIYFIVEGRRTEKKVYAAWLNHLLPNLSRVEWAFESENDNYYLFNGNGFPALLHNHLKNSIEEVNEHGNYDYLVIVLDVDESTVDERIIEVNNFVDSNNIKLINSELVIIPQNKCIETWFLGNRKIYKSNPQSSELLQYVKFYNVKEDDPEIMEKFPSFNTHSQFHAEYCKEFLRERNIRYSKNKPNGVVELDYLNNIIEREQETSHLSSFRIFLDFCSKVKTEMQA
ncbi:hypothetical protein [Reichenbachiella sp. MALMAid0571]|uniref:hypothetical protein n=1 Tax=Reichenbachiella sp. MALMAid0571 TaxID=3143939 RepID=UPI0032DE56FC